MQIGRDVWVQPQPGRWSIGRPRVRDLFDRVSVTGVVLVSAGAGYGKTTALSSWVSEHDDVAFAWVSCCDEHNDQRHLARAILAALELSTDESSHPSLEDAADMIEASGARTVIVLDDAHLLTGDAVLEALKDLLEWRPANLGIVVSGRDEAGVPWHRLRAGGEVTEVRGSDLEFTADEAVSLLRSTFGVDAPHRVVGPLLEATQGWAMGLCLAGHALRHVGADGFDSTEFGRHRYVRGYFDDELLAGMASDEVRFLEVTSVLERLDPHLCDLLTGRSDSGAVLDRFVECNLFTEQISTRPPVFRYHQMFAQYLQDRVGRLGGVDVEEQLAVASRWYEDHGLPALAIEAALRSGEVERAEALIRAASGPVLRSGSARTVTRWLSGLPRESLEANPDLALLLARSAGTSGDLLTASAGLSAFDAYLQDVSRPSPSLGLAYRSMTFLMTMYTGDFVAAKTELELAEALVDEHRSELDRGIYGLDPVDLGSFRAAWHLLNGELDEAIRVSEQILTPGQLVRPGKEAVLALGARALALAWRDESAAARLAVEQSRSAVDAFSGWTGGLLGYLVAAAWNGELPQAQADLARARTIVADLRQPLHRALCQLGEARVELRAGRWDRASASLEEADATIATMRSAGFLGVVADDLRDQLVAGEATDDGASFNEREVDVLRQIAAGASRREAAEHLFLSVNTVKTYLRSAYRKLGATSRDDAVARADELGLLGPPVSQAPR